MTENDEDTPRETEESTQDLGSDTAHEKTSDSVDSTSPDGSGVGNTPTPNEQEVNPIDNTSRKDNGPAQKAADEVYCTSCGEPIKAQAEVCPECGVRQKEAETSSQHNGNNNEQVNSSGNLPQGRAYELQKVARKDITTVMLVSLLLTPAGYLMIGRTGLAILNFLTFNYLLLGFIVVPLHTRKIIKEARDELNRNDIGW